RARLPSRGVRGRGLPRHRRAQRRPGRASPPAATRRRGGSGRWAAASGPGRAYARSVTTFRTVRVAAVQATPVILDAEASVAKAVRLIGEASAGGAELAVLPEAFVSLYPSNRWARAAASFGGADELWERFWQSSLEVPGPPVH